MKPRLRPTLLLATLLLGALAGPAHAQANAADALLKRMAQVNPGLQSYTATAHVDIALHTFPYLSPGLDVNYYYNAPDKQALVFNTVPVIAQQFQKVYPRLDPPATWPSLYNFSVIGGDANATMLRLVPKRHGRVEHLDVKVENATALPSSFTWTYDDGGSVSFDQQYVHVQGDYLIKLQTGKVDLPSYKADVTSTFSNFKVNVPVPDSVFAV